MSRTHGNDDLHRLIHTLLPEEKRYFIRFAKRQTPNGNNYLSLFHEVNNQQVFDDVSLKRKFKNYKVIKVYLKEMIMDCMALYHRHSHPHIHLHNQFQKIHLLIVKGLHDEAMKHVDKALRESRKMELFTLTGALLSLRYKLSAHTFTTNEQIKDNINKYRREAMETLDFERNLLEHDLLNAEWHLQFRSMDLQWHAELEKKRQKLLEHPALSLRAEIRKTAALQWAARTVENAPDIGDTFRRLMILEHRMQSKMDSSYGVVFTMSNYVMFCLEQKQYAKAEKLCNKLTAGSGKTQFLDDVALMMGVIYKLAIYYLTARFQTGLDEIDKNEQKVLEAIKRINDKPRLRFFYAQKIILLFVNQKFRECWLCIRDSLNILKQNPEYLPDVMMLQMMIQVEFGNFDLLPTMVKTSKRKIFRMGKRTPAVDALLHFFKHVSPENLIQMAANANEVIIKHAKSQKTPPAQPIWWLRYDHWLQSKSTGKTIEELVSKEYKSR